MAGRSAYMKQYNIDHCEERRSYAASYRDAHKEEAAAHRESHKEEMRSYNAAYCDAHRDEKREEDAKQRVWFVGNLNIIKAAQGCDDCGTRDGRLDHHHLDPATKTYNVSHMCGYSLEAFMDEIAKCTVLCRSCHKKRHSVL